MNVQLINKPSCISPHEVFHLKLINTVYHLLVKNNEGRGGGGLNREGGCNVNLLPLKSGSLSEGGGLIEDLQYFNLKNSDRRTSAANSCYYGPHWDCNLVSLTVLV